jgi:hypothetical protein
VKPARHREKRHDSTAGIQESHARAAATAPKLMKKLLLSLVTSTAVALCATAAPQTFTGTITDSMCDRADHSQMQMGPTDAECAKNCITDHGASYVLYDGKNAYTLSDQEAAEKLVAKKVIVTGTLDAKTKTIKVASITAAK